MRALLYILPLLFLPTHVFALDDYAADRLSAYDKEYYHKMFDYVMNSKSDNAYTNWTANEGSGIISVGKPYISKSKALCRNYEETFSISGYNGRGKGSGCKREGKAGWCRVKEKDVHSCAMEKSESNVEKAIETGKGAIDTGANIIDKTANFFNR